MGSESIKWAVFEMGQDGFMGHSVTAWLISHPLWALGGLLVSFVLLSGLLRAIAQSTERLWIILLRAPLQLGRWVLNQVLRLLKLPIAKPDRNQLYEKVARLEQLQQEQQQLLQEIKTLMVEQQGEEVKSDRPLLNPSKPK
jgi:hypothetical protein